MLLNGKKKSGVEKLLSLENQIMSHFIRYANDALVGVAGTISCWWRNFFLFHPSPSPPNFFFRFVVKTRKFLKISLIFPLCTNPISPTLSRRDAACWQLLLSIYATFPNSRSKRASLIFNYLSAPPQNFGSGHLLCVKAEEFVEIFFCVFGINDFALMIKRDGPGGGRTGSASE